MSFFNKDLSVDDGVPTPTPSAITPSTSFGWTASTPSLTPAFTPGASSLTGGQKVSYVEEEEEEQEEEENVEEEEPEEDVIKQLAMQNPFTPSNIGGNIGDKFISWGMGSASTPISTPTPSSLASSHVVGPAASPAVPVSPLNAVPLKQGDIKSQIAAWRTKLGASTPLVHNVVATANLGVQLDLKKIALTARNAEYNPRRFAAVIMRIRDPKSTALVFRSGKLVVTGTKSEEEARHAARKFGRVIMKVGFPEARFREFKVENLVSTFTVPFPIHLERMYKEIPPNVQSQYEPEVFPGLIYKVPDTGTLLIFVSGRCVMIGMKTQEDIDRAYLFILPRLEKYRKK